MLELRRVKAEILLRELRDDEDVEGFFRRIGLEQHLSPNRRNGFFSMVEELTRCAAIAEGR